MDKYGVRPEILRSDLREEESQLMMKIQQCLFDPSKKDERQKHEKRLAQVRQELTDTDLGGQQQ